MRLPVSYFGNIEYWIEVLKHESVELEIHETFIKQSLRNKCEIIGANGPIALTVPVIGRSKGFKTKDVLLDFTENWPSKHLHSIQSAYGHSAFYEYYADDIQLFFETAKKCTHLLELCVLSTTLIKKFLHLKQEFTQSTEFQNPGINELRTRYKSGKKEMNYSSYYQTFSERFSFEPNLCILDLIFSTGNEALAYLNQQ